MERGPTPDGDDGSPKRAISPVVGVALMIVITVLLSASIAGALFAFSGELEEPNLEAPAENPWADDPLFGPEDPTAGATDVRYRVYFEIEDEDIEGDSLNEIDITVEVGGDMFEDIEQSDIETFDVERAGDSDLDVLGDINDVDTDSDDDESELEIELEGDGYTEPSTEDVIVVIIGGVDNPSTAGTYDLQVELNEDEDEQEGELEIVEEFSGPTVGAGGPMHGPLVASIGRPSV